MFGTGPLLGQTVQDIRKTTHEYAIHLHNVIYIYIYDIEKDSEIYRNATEGGVATAR